MTQTKPTIWGFYPGEHDGAGMDFGDTNVFCKKGLIGIGWPATGNLHTFANHSHAIPLLVDRLQQAYQSNPDVATWSKEKQQRTFRRWAGVINRFLCEAQSDDIVVYACQFCNAVHVGKIRGNEDGRYKYDGATEPSQRLHRHFHHFRAVNWLCKVPYSDCLPKELKKVRIQNTFWRIKECPERFLPLEAVGI